MSNEKYVRFGPTIDATRHDLIPASLNIKDLIKKRPNLDHYTSIYRYSPKHLEIFKQTKSVKGITDVTTPHIIFDFDNGGGLEQAKDDALTVCRRLIKEYDVPENKIRVYFSGGKGFHVDVLTKNEFSRNEFEVIVDTLAGDLNTFDKTIRDEARILRTPLTKHQKTGLYKFPMTPRELRDMPMDAILEYAKRPEIETLAEEFSDDKYEINAPEKIIQLSKSKPPQIKKDTVNIVAGPLNFKTIDFSRCPKWMPKERWALAQGYFYGSASSPVGHRNEAFMILAATYKAQGFSKKTAFTALQETAELQAILTGEDVFDDGRIEHEILNSVYSDKYRGGIYPKDHPLLVATRKELGIQDDVKETSLIQINDVGDGFKVFAHHIDENTIRTGIKEIDDNVLITTGMMVGLLGAPSSGKSTFANIFAEHLSAQGIPVIYHSLDMYTNLLFIRLLQRYSGYDMRVILDMYKNDSPDKKLLEAYTKVCETYSNVAFNFRSGPTVEEIEQDVIEYKETTGRQPKLLIVDYLEKVRGPFSDPTANSGYVAGRLSDLAKKHDMCVLTLLQPQKIAGDPREELLSMRRVKGASVIEQDCRVILTVWRPGFNPKDMSQDIYTSMAIVKNNMGGLCQLDFGWNGVKGELTDLTDQDRYALKQLREKNEEERAKRALPII